MSHFGDCNVSGAVAGSVMSGIFESAIYSLHRLEPGDTVGWPVWSAGNTPTYIAGSIFSPVQMSPFPYVRAHSAELVCFGIPARVYRGGIRPVLISETSGCKSFRPKSEPATWTGLEGPSLLL